MPFETLPPYIHNTLAPDPHATKHMLIGILCIVIMILGAIMLGCALIVASPFLLIAWLAGGCPTGDNGPYYRLQ